MGLVGREIIQSRTWIDSNPPPAPNLNYKFTFPITVFDAVRKEMNDENSETLTEILDRIFTEINSKQPAFPPRPANYLMTYAGTVGGVGAIQISQDIPWDPNQQRADKIPTERAVGKLLSRLGLTDEDGNITEGGGKKINWSDIIGRPLTYISLGDNEDGYITQKGVTDAINLIRENISNLHGEHDTIISTLTQKIDDHRNNKNNPHDVSLDQIGGVSIELFNDHINADNPHNVTAEQIGLGNVDNTSDLDKPISNATQDALNIINSVLDNINKGIEDLNYVSNITYDQKSGKLTITYIDGTEVQFLIPIDGLVDDIRFDRENNELVVVELGGYEKRVDVSNLFVRYLGSKSPNVTVLIDNEEGNGRHVITATINPHSITGNELANGAVDTSMLANGSITGDKIKDLTITTIKYADNSITTEKIAELAVTNTRLDTRSVDGRVLFSSTVNNRILATLEKGSNPVWTQIVSDMIDINAIETKHIVNRAISSDKLGDFSVISRTISDLAVTNSKIASNAITNEKVENLSISGIKLVKDPIFQGTPSLTISPAGDANNQQIPDTRWVLDRIRDMVITNNNLGDRIVDGRVLFSSNGRNKALVVYRANSDPEWGLINNDMMDEDSVGTKQLIDLSINGDKIKDNSIISRHLSIDSVLTDNIKDSAITSEKIFTANVANRVLASLRDNGHPEYSQVTRQMIENNAISSIQIEDRSVTLPKIQSSDQANRVLAVTLKDSNAEWLKVTGKMIADHTIEGRNISTSPNSDRVLAVVTPGDDPEWLKINGNMLIDDIILSRHISDNAIKEEHLSEKIIDSKHIKDWTIKSNNIAPNAITGTELFTSPIPNRVLAVTTMPYSDPDWLQVTTDMIEDKAITREKIFQSEHPYRVLGSTQGGTPPEYTMITHQFIVDGTIIPSKLVKNFTLQGTPELTLPPAAEADNHQIPDTSWVRKTVANMINDFNPEILYDTITTEMLGDHIVDGTKLFTHPYGPRVLGITKANEDVEFLLIEENLIVDGAVTSNKIARSIQLHGSPTLEVRPSPYACDNKGGGDLIPDCQWVLDRIKESLSDYEPGTNPNPPITPSEWVEIDQPTVNNNWANNTEAGEFLQNEISADIIQRYWDNNGDGPDTSDPGEVTKPQVEYAWDTNGDIPFDTADDENPSFDDETSNGCGSGSSSSIIFKPGFITTELIQDRAVTSEKLFTSVLANRVLAVLESNGAPQYTTINKDMLEDSRLIDASRFFTSDVKDRVLAVTSANEDAVWTKITQSMIDKNSIGIDQIINNSINTDKIINESITKEKLKYGPMIDDTLLEDNVVSNRKIVDGAVDTSKIADKSITTDKLVDEIELPMDSKAMTSTNYGKRAIRNTILSPNAPSGGENGDIWFRYI